MLKSDNAAIRYGVEMEHPGYNRTNNFNNGIRGTDDEVQNPIERVLERSKNRLEICVQDFNETHQELINFATNSTSGIFVNTGYSADRNSKNMLSLSQETISSDGLLDSVQEDWIDRTATFFKAIQNPLAFDMAQVKGDITNIDKEIVYLKSTLKLMLESYDTGLSSYDLCFGVDRLIASPMNRRMDSLHPSLVDHEEVAKIIRTINYSARFQNKTVCVDTTNAYFKG